jgi:lipoprotein-releasing system permease protein
MKSFPDWLFYVSGRFNSVDTKGRAALTGVLSSLGIAFGVTALVVILSVMNGFQIGYIEKILEVSSSHVRLSGSKDDLASIAGLKGVRSIYVFNESQTLLQGTDLTQQGALLRSVPADILDRDAGFAAAITVPDGSFDISGQGTVVLGYELARMLSVRAGDTVSLVALAGGSETDLFPENARLVVRGLFKTGYYAIDSSFAFVSIETGSALTGEPAAWLAGVKLDDLDRDGEFLSAIASAFPRVTATSWRTYNRAFFGALRVEKTMLLLLVVLIFVVVTVNIYNAMRRSVYERREEICVLAALGARPQVIRRIFLMNGFAIGVAGSLTGLLCGLLIAARINEAFSLAEIAVTGINAFFAALFRVREGAAFTIFSPDYFYIDQVPVRMLFPEILFVFLFGILSSASAAYFASRSITKLKPSEVLRYE